MTDSVLLIDLSACFWAAWHSSANDEISAARERTLHKVRSLAKDEQYVAVCCDVGRSFRHDLYEPYKANRPPKDKAAIDELRQTRERLIADGMLLWGCEGLEADDVLATATKEAVNRGLRVTIATADKDLLQLVSGDIVTVLSTITGERRDEAAVIEKYGIPPSMFRDYLALVGDASDNIPGVEKVGPKTAANLLRKYGPIEKIYEAACSEEKELEFLTPVIRGNIVNGGAVMGISRELVTLKDDAPINFEAIFDRREQKKLETRDYEMDEPVEAVEEPVAEPQVAPPEPPQELIAAEKPAKAQSVALVQATFEQELEPRSSGQAWTLAKGLFQSRLYSRFPNAEALWAVIIRGRELGLGAGAALDSFHIIEGRPSPSAHLIIDRAKNHPDCEYFQCIETTPTSATWVTKNRRNPEPTRLTYTFEQAVAAGVTRSTSGKPNNWTKAPDDMIRKTCGVKLARMEYPGAALGLYCAAELGYDE